MSGRRPRRSPAADRGGSRVRRRQLALGGAGGAALLAAACAPAASPAGQEVAPVKAPVKLTYMSAYTAGSVGFQKDEEQFGLFSQAHPSVTIELAPAPGAEVKQKLIVQASGGTPT